jgi:3-carboxy-cis,cis-muconate cycloisomerase
MTGLALQFADEPCAEALSDARLLAAMARFEAAVARACAQNGLVPPEHAEAIASVCEEAKFDTARLARDARRAGTLAIPFVKALTAQVAKASPDAAGYVHLGATSQDVIDTAVVLCLKTAGGRILELTQRLGDAAAALAERHRDTPTVARTLLQPALPIPFGFKAAVWLSILTRGRAQFRQALEGAAMLQFGGAAGTLSSYGEKGDAVSQALAEALSLSRPAIPWHSARDSFARLGSETAILTGAAGKIARDLSLLMQPEVGEAMEPSAPGRGGSSAMPHKRNPALSLLALAAAQRAPGLAATLLGQLSPEHERGLGHWQTQWFTLRDLFLDCSSSLAAMADGLEHLEVDSAAMSVNLHRTRGLVFSEAVSLRLAQSLGKSAAHALTERLCERAAREGKTLEEVLRADPEAAQAIPASEIAALFDPAPAFGLAGAMIDRAVEAWRQAYSSARHPRSHE